MLSLNKKNEVGLDQDEFVKAEDIKEYIAQANKKEFELAFKVNRYMHDLLGDDESRKSEQLQCFFMSLYKKIHRNFQSVLILSARGLKEPAFVLIRSLLDKLFIMKAVSGDNSKIKFWKDSQNAERIKLANAIIKGDKGFENADKREAEKYINRTPKTKSTSQKKWAEWAGMLSDYNIVYRLFSGNVHFSASSFKEDFLFHDQRQIIMNVAPDTEGIDKLLLTGIGYALQTCFVIIEHFSCESHTPEKLHKLQEEYDMLSIALIKNEELSGE